MPEGQALLGGLIDSCFEVVQDIKAREAEDEVAPPLRPIYERLQHLVRQLEQLTLTHRWTLRETDLYKWAGLLAALTTATSCLCARLTLCVLMASLLTPRATEPRGNT